MGKFRIGLGCNVVVVLQLFLLLGDSQNLNGTRLLEESIQANFSDFGVHLHQHNQHVVMSNGIVSVTLTVPGGLVTDITYKGSENLLETRNREDNRGYWDVVWNKPGDHDNMDKLLGTSYKVIVQNKEQTEISFTTTWAVGSYKVPLNVDKRFVMVRGSHGFYTYIVLERLKGWPAFDIQEGRIVFKLQENKFHYMAISDERKRVMPMPVDLATGRVLDYKEAILLTNPKNPELKGEVDDKYLYSCDNKDNKVYGWISSDNTGFWMITPSNEFRTGGPFKQDLTSHVGPTVLNARAELRLKIDGKTKSVKRVSIMMFISTHYAGEDLALKFQIGEYWKKVIGPVYVYLNSHVAAKTNPSVLWNDAKHRMVKEVGSWPYNFPLSTNFLKSSQRGAVTGKLLVHDRLINKRPVPGASAYVGLALPGDAGSWQYENKGYQFWTQTNSKGQFLIKNVVPGTYSLFAFVPGAIGDYKHAYDIKINPGSKIKLKNVVFKPPRTGATLWEIGIPDRTAAEFFIPDPDPSFKIHKYGVPVEKFRQYGLWTRYKDFYPKTDLVFTVGQSDYRKDWFFAHVTRNVGVGKFQATTWQIVFKLKNVMKAGNYTLQLALASANEAEVQVRFNDPKSGPHFTTNKIGRDNALARHGIHGLYHLYSIGVQGSKLVNGNNTIFLTQARWQGPFKAVMYDYIRLEKAA